MRADGFGDLRTDAHDRVERGHGLLEDHGDIAAAAETHGGFGQHEEVGGGVFAGVAGRGQEDPAGDAGGGRKQAQHGEGGCGFSRAGLADQAEGFAGVDGEGEVVDGWARAEADAQVLDAKDGRGTDGGRRSAHEYDGSRLRARNETRWVRRPAGGPDRV